jgi:hypothetical protein
VQRKTGRTTGKGGGGGRASRFGSEDGGVFPQTPGADAGPSAAAAAAAAAAAGATPTAEIGAKGRDGSIASRPIDVCQPRDLLRLAAAWMAFHGVTPDAVAPLCRMQPAQLQALLVAATADKTAADSPIHLAHTHFEGLLAWLQQQAAEMAAARAAGGGPWQALAQELDSQLLGSFLDRSAADAGAAQQAASSSGAGRRGGRAGGAQQAGGARGLEFGARHPHLQLLLQRPVPPHVADPDVEWISAAAAEEEGEAAVAATAAAGGDAGAGADASQAEADARPGADGEAADAADASGDTDGEAHNTEGDASGATGAGEWRSAALVRVRGSVMNPLPHAQQAMMALNAGPPTSHPPAGDDDEGADNDAGEDDTVSSPGRGGGRRGRWGPHAGRGGSWAGRCQLPAWMVVGISCRSSQLGWWSASHAAAPSLEGGQHPMPHLPAWMVVGISCLTPSLLRIPPTNTPPGTLHGLWLQGPRAARAGARPRARRRRQGQRAARR